MLSPTLLLSVASGGATPASPIAFALAAIRRTPIDPRAVAAESALLLLVGGLVMLIAIMVLVGIQNFLPDKADAPGGMAKAPRNEPLRRFFPKPPQHVPSGLAVDKAMARIVHLKLGEPRILQARLHTTRVRLYGCPGCSFEVPGANLTGCTGERGGVERAFKDVYGGRVAAWEIACRRRGDEACDFEVKH